MTRQKDLKQRVRARMAKTGEAYVTARGHVLADRPEPAFDVVETIDVSEAAAALGLRCGAVIFPKLAARVGADVALARLRDALTATGDDPAMKTVRSAVLYGVPPAAIRNEFRRIDSLRDYIRRVQAGIGGASPGGGMLALGVGDVMMLCVAASSRDGGAVIYLQAPDEVIGQRNLSLLVR